MKYINLLLALVFSLSVLGQEAKTALNADKKEYGVITIPVITMNSAPSNMTDVVSQALLGAPVQITGYYPRDWVEIVTHDNYKGYVSEKQLALMTEEEFMQWSRKEKVIITSLFSTVYSEPNVKSQIVSPVTVGCVLAHVSKKGKFVKVEYPNGLSGYIAKSDVAPLYDYLDNVKQDGTLIADYSKKFMGIPYDWGGTSVGGLDCSGYVQLLYFMHNVIIPRDATPQSKVGLPISLDDDYKQLEKGDLLFFGVVKGKITHVGMYLGNKEFIHEATMVEVLSLDPKAKNYSEYRTNSLQSAVRIFGHTEKGELTTIKKSPLWNGKRLKND